MELGDGLSLVRGDAMDAPAEAVWRPGERAARPRALRPRARHPPDEPIPADEARGASPAADRAAAVAGRRGARPARVVARRRGAWQPVPIGSAGHRAASRGSSRRRRSPSCASCSAARAAARPARRGVGARPLRDGLRPAARRRGAVGPPAGARALLDATDDDRAGEPGAAAGGAVRRGGGPRPAAAADGAGARARALRDGRRERRRVHGHVGPSPRASSCSRWRATCARCCATCSAATSSPT